MSLYSRRAAEDNTVDGVVAAGTVLAVRAVDLVLPSAGADGTGMAVAGTAGIRTGDEVVWFVPVVATKAKVRRDGRLQAAGRACEYTSLGHAETILEELTGITGVIDRIAAATTLTGKIKGVRRRSMNIATVIRVVLLMTLMPHLGYRQVLDHLFGDLARIPFEHHYKVPSPSTLRAWRAAIGAAPLQDLLAATLAGTRAAHATGTWKLFEAAGLMACAIDGTVTRMKDTIVNRAAFGAATTNAPFPQIRHLHVTDAATRSVLAMATGPAGGDKAEAEQALLDHILDTQPGLFTPDRIWIMDRNYPGIRRIRRILATGTHILIRLKSDIRLERVGDFAPDGSWTADMHGDGITVRVRVIEYVVELDNQIRPESYCLITDLTDHHRWPAKMLADLYPRRWDGSETSINENKSTIHGAGPSTGAILRSGTPHGITGEHAAWITTGEIVRALIRDATALATPITRGPRTGQTITPRDLSFTRARHILTSNIRPIPGHRHHTLHALAATRGQPDRHRHRDRVTKAAPTFPNQANTPTLTHPCTIHTYGTGPASQEPADQTTPTPRQNNTPTPRQNEPTQGTPTPRHRPKPPSRHRPQPPGPQPPRPQPPGPQPPRPRSRPPTTPPARRPRPLTTPATPARP